MPKTKTPDDINAGKNMDWSAPFRNPYLDIHRAMDAVERAVLPGPAGSVV